jgi:hypothetical protein
MPWKHNGKVIKLGRGWTDVNGYQHPANWGSWTAQQKTDKNLIWEADPTPYDNRFYWGRNADDSLIPKSLDDVVNINPDTSVTVTDELGFPTYTLGLKTQYKNQTNETANNILQPTDWMVIANTERSRTISTSVTNYRAAVVSCATQIKADIDACTSIGEFENLFVNTTVSTAPIHKWPTKLHKV